MKILIIQTAFIGDVILATALIEKLGKHFPNAQIDFVLRKGNESLLQNNPHLHNVIVFDKKNKYRNLIKLIGTIRKQRYHHIINVQRFFTTGLITALSKGKKKIGFDKNPLSVFYSTKVKHIIDGRHEVERNQMLIKHLTDEVPEKPKLYPLANNAKQTHEPYICMAPTSVWHTKQFPQHKWIELIEKTNDHVTVYLLGGKADWSFCNDIEKALPHKPIKNLAGKLSFLESAALMKHAKMNYVNDSAPLHMASSVNAPVTAFFCSTVPQFGFYPLSGQSFIKETFHHLDCRPCGLHGYTKCPKGHFKCAEIEV